MQVAALEYSDFVGRIAIGKIRNGKIRKNQRIALMKQKDGSRVDDTVVQVLGYDRLGKLEMEEMSAGDICALVGPRRRGHRRHGLRFRPPRGDGTDSDRRADARQWFSASTIRRSPGKTAKPLTNRELKELSLPRTPVERGPARPPERTTRGRVHRLRARLAASVHSAGEHPAGRVGDVGGQTARHHEGNQRRQNGAVRISRRGRAFLARRPRDGLVLERQAQCQRMESGTSLTHLEFLIPRARPDRVAHEDDDGFQRPGDRAS